MLVWQGTPPYMLHLFMEGVGVKSRESAWFGGGLNDWHHCLRLLAILLVLLLYSRAFVSGVVSRTACFGSVSDNVAPKDTQCEHHGEHPRAHHLKPGWL